MQEALVGSKRIFLTLFLSAQPILEQPIDHLMLQAPQPLVRSPSYNTVTRSNNRLPSIRFRVERTYNKTSHLVLSCTKCQCTSQLRVGNEQDVSNVTARLRHSSDAHSVILRCSSTGYLSAPIIITQMAFGKVTSRI